MLPSQWGNDLGGAALPYDSMLWHEYFLYFLDSDGTLRARHQFIAESDAEAIECATFLISTCSDVCASGELWSRGRPITQVFANAALSPDDLNRFSVARQEQIIDIEEMILQSRSQLALSRQIAQSVEAARKQH